MISEQLFNSIICHLQSPSLVVACTSNHRVWDLRNKCEVVALAYGRAGQVDIIGDGGRKGMSGVTWHPDNVS